MIRVSANGPGDLGSIPGRVIPKTQKMVLDASLLHTQHYKVRIKVKWSNPGKGVAPFLAPWCNSYRKGSLRVTLDSGRELTYLLFFHFRQHFLFGHLSQFLHYFYPSTKIIHKWDSKIQSHVMQFDNLVRDIEKKLKNNLRCHFPSFFFCRGGSCLLERSSC